MFKFSLATIFLFLFFTLWHNLSFAGSPQLTYQGRILTAAGEPVTRPVMFKLQIRSPGSEDCIMYEETQTQDLTNTNGMFSLSLNGASSTRTDGGTYSFSRILANKGTFTFSAGKCASGLTYVSSPTDNRNLKVFFNEGSGWENLPLQAINHVPLAVEALQVGGFSAASLLRVDDNGVPGNIAPLTTDYFTELISLITGISTQYTKASSNGTVVIPETNSPSNLSAGQLWYESGSLKYYNGSTTVTLNSSGSAINFSQLPVGTTSTTVVVGNDSRVVNAIQNDGYAKSIKVGADASRPTSHTLGQFYVASDAQKIYYNNGSTWITVADVNSVAGVTSSTITNALGYSPLNPASNLSDISSSATARSNLGLGSLASFNFLDLGSSYASGTLSMSRLPAFTGDLTSTSGTNILMLNDIGSGVVSGSQYTKVTVDGKGRITSGSSLSSSDITGALGFVPASTASATQWSTSGTSIHYSAGKVGIGTVSPSAPLNVYGETSTDDFIALFAQNGITPESSVAVMNTGKAVSVQGNGAAYFMGRDVVNDIEFVMGTSSNGSAFAGSMTSHDFQLRTNNTTRVTIQNTTGNVGVGTTAPSAKLHIASGTSSLAPLKFTSGTLMSSPGAGSVEYDGFNLYFTDGANTRRTLASIDSTGTQNNTSIISNSSNITLSPTGSVIVSSTTASTSSSTGALVVNGGLGIAGNIYASGTIVTSSNIQGSSITATSGVSTTVITGVPYLSLNPSGGNVGIGTISPATILNLSQALGPSLRLTNSTTTSGGHNGQIEFATDNSTEPGVSAKITAIRASGAGHTNMQFTVGTPSAPIVPLYLEHGGFVGIGTTNPAAKLEVQSSSGPTISMKSAAPWLQFVETDQSNKVWQFIGVSGNFVLYENNSATPRMTFKAGGDVGIGTTSSPLAKLEVNGHIAASGGAATVGSCGTSPAITGNDTKGYVTIGSGATTSCVITFNSAFTFAPVCTVTWRGAASAIGVGVAATTTALTVNFTSDAQSLSFNYHCLQ